MHRRPFKRDSAPLAAGCTCAAILTAATCCLALSACGPDAPKHPPSQAGMSAADTAEFGYLSPPTLTGIGTDRAGELVLTGFAPPGAMVTLNAPERDAFSTHADPKGVWRIKLAPVTRPRMFAFMAESEGRLVHAEGALLLMPHPGPAALLVRAGAGALVFDRPSLAPTLDALDYDPGGSVAVAGRARPGATVRLTLDGAPAGSGQADKVGRYTILAANRRLPFGPHAAAAQTAEGGTARRFDLTAPDSLTRPYQVQAESGAWRLEWAIPGGGVQTTLVFKPGG